MRAGYVSVLSGLFLGCLGIAACSTPSSELDEASATGLASPDPDHELTLADVTRALDARQAGWTAGETSFSTLPQDERRGMLGVPLSELSDDEMVVEEESPSVIQNTRAAAAHDWRDIGGSNYVSPMLDQGRCGSCVAFAAVATLETQFNIAAQDTSSPWQLSPQYLFACGGGRCNSGWQPGSAASFMVNRGVPDNACMPYTSGASGNDAKCSAACAGATARSLKAKSFSTPTTGTKSVAAVKLALEKGPLMTTFTVYEDFGFYKSGVYKHVTGKAEGGHAVSIVGWNDARQSWIVRNSWGSNWGVNGYFEVAWSDTSGVSSRTWGFGVATPGPHVALAGIRDGALLSGQHALSFDTQSIGASALSWTLQSGTSTVAQGFAPSASATTLDTTSVADGVYVLRPHAGSGATRIDGPPHLVYILNGTETGNIRFTALTSGQTVKGTVKFDLAVTAQPVPATHVEWTIVDAAGAVVVDRVAGNTGPRMAFSWNSKKWPNGTYTVRVTGGAGTQMLQPATAVVKVQN